jgi:hypothetical protein
METAKRIRKLNWGGPSILCELSKPMEYMEWWEDRPKKKKTNHVIVTIIQGDEKVPEQVNIFPADKHGEVIDLTELNDGYGLLRHEDALKRAGYTLIQ